MSHLPIDHVPGAPPPEVAPDKDTLDPQEPNLTYPHDPTKTMAHREVVGVDNVVGKANGKATGLYNKHRKYSEQWNPCNPIHSAHNLQQTRSFTRNS